MSSHIATVLADLRAFVSARARAPSESMYDQCSDRCRRYDHPLFGPYLQYKKDDFHLGRSYVLVSVASLYYPPPP